MAVTRPTGSLAEADRAAGRRPARAGAVPHEVKGRAVTVPQDPAVIQQQIENTRAELAETVDAIAEIVSPKRVAERAAAGVRGRVDHLKGRVKEVAGSSRSGPPALPGGAGTGSAPGGGPVLAEGGSAPARTVRWDRVGVAGGLVVLLVVLTAWRRHSGD